MTQGIFVSSVQREFAEERRTLRNFIQRDPLMRRFFSVLLFKQILRRRATGAAGHPATGQVTGQVEGWIVQALSACLVEPRARQEIQEATGFRHREPFQCHYLDALLSQGLLERTIPGKPTSRLQKYRITDKGRTWLADHRMGGGEE